MLKPAVPSLAFEQGLTEEERKAKALQEGQTFQAAMRKRIQEIRDSGALLGSLKTASWYSITTEELASMLVRIADAPVVDKTGLTGEYSVSIETWGNGDVPGGTVFDAVEKLGLKLEPRRVAVETVVVDQVSKTPTANLGIRQTP